MKKIILIIALSLLPIFALAQNRLLSAKDTVAASSILSSHHQLDSVAALKQNIIPNLGDTVKYAKMWGGTKIDSAYVSTGQDSLIVILGAKRFGMKRVQAY